VNSGQRPVNPTAAALLGLLLDGPRSGWDLLAAAQERIGEFWTLTPSQVYRELAAMAERGFIAAEATGPRDRKPYRLTESGRQAFAEWLATEPATDQVRIPLLLTLAFAEHLDRERLDAIVTARRAVHEDRLRRFEQRRAELDAVGDAHVDDSTAARIATLEFGLRHERAVLEWFAALSGILDRRA
jgi:DNA-binding PadR family transcriptional regulator